MFLAENENGDIEILDYDEMIAASEEGPIVNLGRLELLWSVDHGLRTADETAFVVGENAAAEVMIPLMKFLAIGPVDIYSVDYVGALPADVGSYDGDGWADDPDVSQRLYEWSDEMTAAASDAGFIIESSGDAGMTWCYSRI